MEVFVDEFDDEEGHLVIHCLTNNVSYGLKKFDDGWNIYSLGIFEQGICVPYDEIRQFTGFCDMIEELSGEFDRQ